MTRNFLSTNVLHSRTVLECGWVEERCKKNVHLYKFGESMMVVIEVEATFKFGKVVHLANT